MKILNNLKKNTILLLIITSIVLFVVLKDDWQEIIHAFQHIDIKYAILAVFLFSLSVTIKGYINYLITNNKKKVSFRESVKHSLITQFFNGITPFATGGQPMEIYMLTEHDISLANATNQTIQSFIFYQIALVICGILAVIYNSIFHIFPKVRLLQYLVLIGFIINIGVAVVLIMISYSEKVTNKLSNIAIRIVKKVKGKADEKAIKKLFEDYYNGFKELKKRKGLFTVGILLNIASLLCVYSIPLFILYSMGDFTSLTLVEALTASAYVYVIGGFVPIPGASGGIEYSFTQFYGNFIGLNIISAVLLLWRTITYYFGIIIGAVLFNFEKKVKK